MPDFSRVKNSVIKDTVVVPVSGYVVLQFVARNPGFWAFQCHVDQHVLAGMSLVFKVSHPDYGLPKTLRNLPTCYDTAPFNNALGSFSAISSLVVVCVPLTMMSMSVSLFMAY